MRRWIAASAGLALGAASFGAIGCASAPRAASTAYPGTAGAIAEPWQLPATQANRQSLLRLQLSGARGDGSLRAVLRLMSPERYELAASDPLGRPLWTLDATGGSALWIDHRARRSCELGDQLRLPDLGLPAMLPAALPVLLLGRLPALPATTEAHPPGELRDAKGRRWTWREQHGVLETWTLWQGAEPALWWRRQESGGVLSARREGAQVRWQIVVSEPLAAPLGPSASPAGYAAGDCDELALP